MWTGYQTAYQIGANCACNKWKPIGANSFARTTVLKVAGLLGFALMFVIFSKSNPLFVIVFSLSIHLTYSSVALSADVALRAPCFFKCVPCLLQGRFQLLCGSEGKTTESVGQYLGMVGATRDCGLSFGFWWQTDPNWVNCRSLPSEIRNAHFSALSASFCRTFRSHLSTKILTMARTSGLHAWKLIPNSLKSTEDDRRTKKGKMVRLLRLIKTYIKKVWRSWWS